MSATARTGQTGQTGATGPVGPVGPAGASGGFYQHTQGTPSDMWIVNHGVGYFPSTEVLDESGYEVEAEVQHVSEDQLVVRFLTPTTGKVNVS